MIKLGGLMKDSVKLGKMDVKLGQVVSNPYVRAFAPTNEGEEGSDYEVSMAAKQLDDIIKSATELKAKMGQKEFNVAAWIQDHISKSQDYINQANYGFNKNEDDVNESKILVEYDSTYFASPEFTEKIIDTAVKESKKRLSKVASKGYLTQKEFRQVINPLYNSGYTGNGDGEKGLRKKFENINEGKNWAKLMAGIKKGSQSGPWTIVVSRNKKVVYQQIVKVKDAIPANVEHMKSTSALKGDIYAIEDNHGQIVYSEKI